MADKFEDLRTYVTVVSNGGINAAAAELGIAKSAVSRRIAELEARLGVSLIERSTRRFEVTATGRAYLDRAKRLLAELEALDADPSSLTATGSVSISAPAAVTRHLLAPAVATFARTRAGLTVRLSDAGQQADVEIGSESTGRHLADVHHVLCASPGYLEEHGRPETTADLMRHAAVQASDGHRSWRFANGATRSPRATVSAADPDVMLALTVAGAGIAQLPDFVAGNALSDGRLVSLLPGDAPSPDRLTVSVAAQADPAAHALVDHLVASLSIRR